jgi:integrase
VTTFAEFLPVVLTMREQDGVRGIGHEHNRKLTHIDGSAFVDKELADVTSVDIRDWLRVTGAKNAKDHRGERRLHTGTVNRAYALVRAVFTVAVERDMIKSSPCVGVKVKKRVDATTTKETWTVLTLDEQKALVSCTAIPIADRFAIRFALGTGMRQGEQFSLRVADLITGNNEPHVVVRFGGPKDLPTKSGKTRRVPLFKDSLECARQWSYELATWAPENPLGLVFPTARGRRRGIGKPLGNGGVLKRHLALVGITRRVRWHDLRHSAATNLLNGSLGRVWTLPEVREFLGHSSVSMTERYTHLSFGDLARAAEATVGPGIVPAAPDTSPEFDIPNAPDTSRELETWFEEEAVAS